jgi:hypothetical protein
MPKKKLTLTSNFIHERRLTEGIHIQKNKNDKGLVTFQHGSIYNLFRNSNLDYSTVHNLSNSDRIFYMKEKPCAMLLLKKW